MALDNKAVASIAFLARIKVPDADLAPLARELDHIIGWVEQLSEVATDGVEPMTSVAAMSLPRRDDRVTDGNYADKVLANAPEAEKGFFAVPKVVE